MVTHFAIQIPTWLVIVIVAAVVLGAWKLVTLVVSALSH